MSRTSLSTSGKVVNTRKGQMKSPVTATPVEFEVDGHRFRSEEHQCHFEVIKDWSFLKERRVQLAEGGYIEFQTKIARRH